MQPGEEGQEVGHIPKSADACKTARFLIDAWEGAVIRMKITASREPLGDFVDIAISLLRRGNGSHLEVDSCYRKLLAKVHRWSEISSALKLFGKLLDASAPKRSGFGKIYRPQVRGEGLVWTSRQHFEPSTRQPSADAARRNSALSRHCRIRRIVKVLSSELRASRCGRSPEQDPAPIP
ncbi:hypothetical protein CO662_21845 [Rhizobium anhuiense]|uniref:Uncharacterized protein n=1 Tax=Rhizobium anhuiense TaxID=1184720 RepID=A0ABX4J5V3_9HYPH|nr:hypothetical protein CO662_21845 [Rhizobium anhuiense]